MTATQAPTPGPLSGNHTALVATITYLRADEGDTVSLLCDNPDFSGQPSNAVECNGGWTDWTDKRFNGDSLFAALNNAALAKAVATKTLSPTAPVEASGSEREMVAAAAWNAARAIGVADGEDDAGPWPPTAGQFGWQEDDSEACRNVELAKADAAIAALRPQPSGETIEQRFPALNDHLIRMASSGSTGSLAEWGDFFECLRAALSTTPARAEAQDEGAAEEAWIIDAGASAWATMDREEAARFSQKEGFKVRRLVTAHPSPTLAADADRVRIAVEALEPFVPVWAKLTGLSDGIDVRLDASFALQDATGRARGATCNPNLPKLTVGDFRKAHNALAALKSTAAKEGGEL